MTSLRMMGICLIVFIIACQGPYESDDGEWPDGEWQLTREPEENLHYYAIHFVDQKYGWAAGENGTIIFTSDGGSTWRYQPSGIMNSLHTVYFIDRLVGWIGGSAATLITTKDGGESWQRLSLPMDTTNGIYSLYFADEYAGWAVARGEVLHTQDGGETWEAQLSWERGGGGRLSFVDRTVGYVLPVIDTLLWRTQDGGNHWSSFRFREAQWPTDMFFLDEQTGWICNTKLPSSSWPDYANVFYTNDGGDSWICLDTLDELHLNDIQFVDDQVGWVTAMSKIYRTTDGGSTWECEYNSEEEDIWLGFWDLFFIDDAHGWALDYKGGICTYKGS